MDLKRPRSVSKQINPLPAKKVGPRLLVRLQAEKVIIKAGLKESWEDEGGWDFDDLCALVACLLGNDYAHEREKVEAGRVLSRDMDQLSGILKWARPKGFTVAEREGQSIPSDAYEAGLILGIGTDRLPIPGTEKFTSEARLVTGLAKLLQVREDVINARNFEYAKRKVKERYEEHLARTKARVSAGCVPRHVRQSRAKLRSILIGFGMKPSVVNGLIR